MNELSRWCHTHPYKACLYTVLFVLCGSLWAECDWKLAAAVTFAVWLIFELVVRLDLKRMASLLVAVALAPTPAKAQDVAQAPLVGRAVAAAVVVGGGYVVTKFIDFCRRKFPRDKQTNAPPQQFMVAGEAGEYGALFTWGLPESCEQLAERTPVGSQRATAWMRSTLFIDVTTSNATVTIKAEAGSEFVTDFAGLQEELNLEGLMLSASPEPGASYSRNRHACEAGQVPISFNADTRTIRHGVGGIVVTVERSASLRGGWEPFLNMDVEGGSRLAVADAASEASMFYRVRTEER